MCLAKCSYRVNTIEQGGKLVHSNAFPFPFVFGFMWDWVLSLSLERVVGVIGLFMLLIPGGGISGLYST